MAICWLCHTNFNEISFLINHLKILHNLKNITEFKCKEIGCYRILGTLNSFKKHIKEHTINLTITNSIQSVSSNFKTNISEINITNIEHNKSNIENIENNSTNIENNINDNNDFSENDHCTLTKFKELIQLNSLLLVTKWYNETGVPRNKVQDILNDVQSFFYTSLLIKKKKLLII